jgi:SulP family sulfate permease
LTAGAVAPRRYGGGLLRADVTAGLTAAAVVIPKALAYATIAGLPIQVGLYTAFAPLLAYALLGTSRPLSVTTTSTIAILIAGDATVAHAGPGEILTASATLSVLVGVMLIAASLLRLGFVANFISDPVLTGFKAGVGLVIVADQLPKLLGFHIHKEGFFRDLVAIASHLPATSLPTLALAAGIIALLVALEHFAPRAPAPLVAVAVGVALSSALGLHAMGVETVGEVPRALPTLVWPRLDLLLALWPSAVGIALMSFTESIAAARAFAQPEEPRPQPNRELLASGAANVAGGFLGAMVAGGGTSQTAVNRSAGARTQVTGVVVAAISLATGFLLAPLIGAMPNAVLAAVVVVYSVPLIKPADFRELGRFRRTETVWAVIALAGVALLGTLRGIVVAVIASLLSLAQQAYDPPVYLLGRKRGTDVFRPPSAEHPDDETWPGLLLVRTDGRLFFANAQRVGDKIWAMIQAAKPKVLVLDFSAVIDLEYTALKMLSEADEHLRREGVTLWLAALNPEVYAAVARSKLGQALGRERMLFNLQRAVEQFERGAR